MSAILNVLTKYGIRYINTRDRWFHHLYTIILFTNIQNFTTFKTNIGHACTHLNVFHMVILNIVTIFQNVDIFENCCDILYLVCRVEMVKQHIRVALH